MLRPVAQSRRWTLVVAIVCATHIPRTVAEPVIVGSDFPICVSEYSQAWIKEYPSPGFLYNALGISVSAAHTVKAVYSEAQADVSDNKPDAVDIEIVDADSYNYFRHDLLDTLFEAVAPRVSRSYRLANHRGMPRSEFEEALEAAVEILEFRHDPSSNPMYIYHGHKGDMVGRGLLGWVGNDSGKPFCVIMSYGRHGIPVHVVDELIQEYPSTLTNAPINMEDWSLNNLKKWRHCIEKTTDHQVLQKAVYSLARQQFELSARDLSRMVSYKESAPEQVSTAELRESVNAVCSQLDAEIARLAAASP